MRITAIHLTLTALALTLASGCVSQSEHDALAKELGETRAALVRAEGQSTSLEAALQQERVKIKQLEAQIGALNEQIRVANAQLLTADEKLALTLKDRSRLKASVDEMKEALALARRQRELAEARVGVFKQLLARFQTLIDTGKLQVKIVDGRMVLVLPSDVLFASGSTKISDDGKNSLIEVTKILTTLEQREFQVEGHTDNVPINTERFHSNWELAAGRAIEVTNVMIGAGLAPERLSAASYGEFRPAASNADDPGRAQNRRIEIVWMPELAEVLPYRRMLEQLEQRGERTPGAAE